MKSHTLVDSHCHLDLMNPVDYDGELAGIIDEAKAADVSYLLSACVSLETFPSLQALASQFPNVWTSVGVHPNQREAKEPGVDELAELAGRPKVVAIGETGLDYFRSTGDLDWQRARFRRHIQAAKQSTRPLIVHSRDAGNDTLDILEEERAGDAGGVMHCFVEDWESARRAMEIGFYISFSGIVTFKNAQDLKEVAKRVPLDRLLVETDSPYLAPVPVRGKPNQPAYVRHVAEYLAKLKGIDVDTVFAATTENFFRLFAAARPPEGGPVEGG
ncbi:MAG: hypothetical protein DRQ37_04100 [Gammaproteobacteria bacterium]|nr:MAG: hypothetical protein DRQ37_04100 [Gammaproteobacteria bacterium]